MDAKNENSTIALTKSGNVNLLNSDARGIFELNIVDPTKVAIGTPANLPAHRLISTESENGHHKLKVLLTKGEYIRCVTKTVFNPSDWSPTFSVETAPVVVERESFFKVSNHSGRKQLVEVSKPEGVRFSNVKYTNSMCSEVYKIVWGQLFKDFPMLILHHCSQFAVRFIHGTRSMKELRAMLVIAIEEDGSIYTVDPSKFAEIQGTGRLFLLQCSTGDFVYLSSDEKALKEAERKFVSDMSQFDRVDIQDHGGQYSVFPALPSAVLEQLNAPLRTVKSDV